MPETDPSDGEIHDVNEFLSELAGVERDEDLVSLLGDGLDVAAGDDQDLADMLGRWRDDIDREPSRNFTVLAETGQHPTGSMMRPTNTGGQVSISDDANALRSIQMPFGEIQQAMQVLDGVLEQAAAILGSSGAGLGEVQGAVGQAKSDLDGAYSAVQQVERTLDEVAARHQGS